MDNKVATISARQVQGVRDTITKFDTDMRGAVDGLLANVMALDEDAMRAVMHRNLQPLFKQAVGASETMARAVYGTLRKQSIGETINTIAGDTFDEGTLDAMVNTAVKAAVDGSGVESVRSIILGRFGYDIRNAYAVTIARNAAKDPRKPRYARVPSGTETCSFCMMLASRGFVYASGRKGQKTHNHANCDCVYIPGWGDNPTVEGYDNREWYERWQNSIEETASERARNSGEFSVEKMNDEVQKIYDSYAKSASISKKAIPSKWKAGQFNDFNDVQSYLISAPTTSELEHRYSVVGRTYGFENMGNQRIKNAIRTAEHRIAQANN